MDFRNEWKHEISFCDMLVIRSRLSAIAKRDSHAENGSYTVRSLYFDTQEDTALREKLDGVSRREKFRIRYYNGDPSVIHLEKKSKIAGLGSKRTADLTLQQVRMLINGETDRMAQSENELVQELCLKMRTGTLRAKTIVDYTREPFVFAPGNVRVTLDYNIRTTSNCAQFEDPDCATVPIPGSPVILEVKWDEFLPDIIRDAVQLEGRRTSSFSKYAACRVYG